MLQKGFRLAHANDAAIAQLQAMLFGIGSHDLEVLVQLASLEFIFGDGHGIKPSCHLHDAADFFLVGVLVKEQLGLVAKYLVTSAVLHSCDGLRTSITIIIYDNDIVASLK